MRSLPHLLVCGVVSIAALSVAGAVTYTDTFSDGTANGGADNSGIAWFDRSANSNLTVDASGGALSGNALNLNLGSASTAGNIVGSRGIIGVLGTTFTPAIGDSLSLSFDFQFRATPNETLPANTFTTTPRNSSQGFTFGFYSSNGTAVGADDSTNSDNDRGFRGSIGSGTTAAAGIFRETNAGAGGLGTTTTSGTPPNTTIDSADITNVGASTVNVNDFLKHSGLFTMTRTGADEYTFEIKYDDTSIATGTSTIGAYTSFNEVVFSQGGSNNFSIDNVVVTFVPEPAAAMLGALGALMLLRRRR